MPAELEHIVTTDRTRRKQLPLAQLSTMISGLRIQQCGERAASAFIVQIKALHARKDDFFALAKVENDDGPNLFLLMQPFLSRILLGFWMELGDNDEKA